MRNLVYASLACERLRQLAGADLELGHVQVGGLSMIKVSDPSLGAAKHSCRVLRDHSSSILQCAEFWS